MPVANGAKCFLITQDDRLMPGVYLGDSMWNGKIVGVVEAPTGKTYTVSIGNVVSENEGREMLQQRRAEELPAQGYKISVRKDGTLRVFHPGKHGEQGGYILTEVAPCIYSCTCPAYESCGLGEMCKHGRAVCILLRHRSNDERIAGNNDRADALLFLALYGRDRALELVARAAANRPAPVRRLSPRPRPHGAVYRAATR